MANKYTAGWTPAEDQILRDNYAKLGTKGCASLLPDTRSIGAIYRRASLIGLKRTFVPPPPSGLRAHKRARVHLGVDSRPGQSVSEWLAQGGKIERLSVTAGRQFTRIRPELGRPSMPVRGIA